LLGTWLGKSVVKKDQRTTEFAATDAAPDAETKPTDVSSACKVLAYYIADDRCGSSVSVAILTPRPLT
jgi:ribosomal protein S11